MNHGTWLSDHPTHVTICAKYHNAPVGRVSHRDVSVGHEGKIGRRPQSRSCDGLVAECPAGLTVVRIQGDDVVSVRLRVERSSAVPSGIGDAGVEFQQTIYETSLRLHTGRTGVMGGLREILETKTESGVPGLMHLPGIGRLFRSTQSSGADRELVVLLTAVIVE